MSSHGFFIDAFTSIICMKFGDLCCRTYALVIVTLLKRSWRLPLRVCRNLAEPFLNKLVPDYHLCVVNITLQASKPPQDRCTVVAHCDRGTVSHNHPTRFTDNTYQIRKQQLSLARVMRVANVACRRHSAWNHHRASPRASSKSRYGLSFRDDVEEEGRQAASQRCSY